MTSNLAEYPDDPASAECVASVCQARGQPGAAAELFRRAAAAMRARGEGDFCDCCYDSLLENAQRLESAASASLPQSI
ncbi:MAG: hypothetical protein IT371_23015 [Deltaproteobacteria bacterium]|nr:hypothetical protein [Deltaproteobacteria bacterium]